MAATLELTDGDPKTYKQALKLPDAAASVEECAAEVASLVENEMFEVVHRPAAKPVIPSNWVVTKKRGLSGQMEKYKARLVVRGFMQEEGVDYTEPSSPTVRFESVRMMVAAAASGELHPEQMAVTPAFPYAEVEKEMCSEVPEGIFNRRCQGRSFVSCRQYSNI